jgi:hypothetical protein
METVSTNRQMLTRWSGKYVNALFRSGHAKEPRIGRFRRGFERKAFMDAMAARKNAGVVVEPLPDGPKVRIKGAGRGNLLDIVRLAQQCGGEILFPGALPG